MIRKVRNGQKRLDIFENFSVDTNLPKHKKGTSYGSDMNGTISVGGSWNSMESVFADHDDMHSGELTLLEKLSYSHNFFDVIMYKILRTFKWGDPKKKKESKIKVTEIDEFFRKIKLARNVLGISDTNSLVNSYELAVKQAENLGQTALKEQLLDAKKLLLLEACLVEKGWKDYLTEQQLMDFYELTDSSKNLKLVWIKNFVRIIPEYIVEQKKQIDDLKIFDNYVILTFDPLNQMESMTKQEVEKAKDPILFGVIEGSNKLYFIADWEDEYCNLRLSDVLDTLSDGVNKLGNETVNFYLTK